MGVCCTVQITFKTQGSHFCSYRSVGSEGSQVNCSLPKLLPHQRSTSLSQEYPYAKSAPCAGTQLPHHLTLRQLWKNIPVQKLPIELTEAIVRPLLSRITVQLFLLLSLNSLTVIKNHVIVPAIGHASALPKPSQNFCRIHLILFSEVLWLILSQLYLWCHFQNHKLNLHGSSETSW